MAQNAIKESGDASGTTDAVNPHARMHKFVYRITLVCLIAQVIEGSLIVPYVLIYFGFPQLSLTEVCDEVYKIAYVDEERECVFPYPLGGEPEPWISPPSPLGPHTPPAPGWALPGFRGVIGMRAELEARKASGASNGSASAGALVEQTAGVQGDGK